MAKTPMPQVVGDGKGCGGGVGVISEEGVEVAGAIRPHDNLPGVKILQRKTKWVKFNGAVVVTDKFSSGTKILD
jgi:hypothetical protein